MISEQCAPVDCKDGRIADVYKGKGDAADCNNSRGILIQDHIGTSLVRLCLVYLIARWLISIT